MKLTDEQVREAYTLYRSGLTAKEERVMQSEARQAIDTQVMNPRVREFLHKQDDFEVAVYLTMVDDVNDLAEGERVLNEVVDHGWEAYGPFRGFDEFDYWQYAWEAYRESEDDTFLLFLNARQGNMDVASPDGIDELVLGIAVEEVSYLMLGRLGTFEWEDNDAE